MSTYVLVTITNIQGPLGQVTLRFSNLGYVVDAGPFAGESFQDSWTAQSFNAFAVGRIAHTITPEGLLLVGGTVPPSVADIEVANNFTSGRSSTRQLDYLFGPSYDLSDARVLIELKETVDGSPPPYASFVPCFTGRLSKRPTRSADAVKFYFEPVMAELAGPMLTYRHTGMGAYYLFTTASATEGNPPAIIAVDFTLQFYGSFFTGDTGPSHQTLYRIENSSNVPLIDLYMDTQIVDLGGGNFQTVELLTLDVKYATGTDTYTIWSRIEDEQGLGRPFWATIVWDQTGGTFSAWVNGTKFVDESAILNTPTGTPDHNVFGDVDSSSAAMISAIRVYDTAHDEAEALRREGPIDYAEDSTIINAWEFDDGIGLTATDYGPNGFHIPLPAGSWIFRQLDGERGVDGEIAPLILGSVFGAPVQLVNPKEPSGLLTVSGDRIVRAYSKGVPLSTSVLTTSTFRFDHLVGSIRATTGDFGRRHVPGESIQVLNAFSSQYNGSYVIKSISPTVTGSLVPSGVTDLLTVTVESHTWTSSGTGTATVQTDQDVGYNWLPWDGAGLEENPYDGTNILGLTYEWLLSQPLTADVIGDPEIYVTSPPAGFANPDDLGNVLLQAMRTYGPAWDDSIVPPPYAYGAFTNRVGYYVSGSMSTDVVVNDLSRGCLTWVQEDDEGKIRLRKFAFPESVGSSEEVFAEDVVTDSVVTDRLSATTLKTVSSSWITSVITRYARNWTPLRNDDVPQAVDPDVRSFVTREWREVISGDTGKVTTDTPVFYTYENRKAEAKDLGDTVLRLSRGEVAEFDVRMSPEDQLSKHAIGSKMTGDLTALGLGNVPRIVIGREAGIGSGLLRLAVWFEW